MFRSVIVIGGKTVSNDITKHVNDLLYEAEAGVPVGLYIYRCACVHLYVYYIFYTV